MAKSPEAFRTIREVAEQLDVPAHVLRFWETRFTQIKPVKRGGGRRYYRPDDVRLLRGIRGLLYDDGMTIKGVQKILREQGVRHVIGLGTVEEPAPSAPPPAREPVAPPAAAPAARAEPAFAGADAGPQADPFPPSPEASADADAPPAPPEGEREGMGDAGQDDTDPGAGQPRSGGEEMEAMAAGPGGGRSPLDREALRRLVRELEALRAVMVGDKGR